MKYCQVLPLHVSKVEKGRTHLRTTTIGDSVFVSKPSPFQSMSPDASTDAKLSACNNTCNTSDSELVQSHKSGLKICGAQELNESTEVQTYISKTKSPKCFELFRKHSWVRISVKVTIKNVRICEVYDVNVVFGMVGGWTRQTGRIRKDDGTCSSPDNAALAGVHRILSFPEGWSE
jgi:hypothetical protein